MRFPIIRVKDKADNTVHIVGTDTHDDLIINDGQTISYNNLQNGEGTGEYGDYRFEGEDIGDLFSVVEMVSFEELKDIYEAHLVKEEISERRLQKILEIVSQKKGGDKG